MLNINTIEYVLTIFHRYSVKLKVNTKILQLNINIHVHNVHDNCTRSVVMLVHKISERFLFCFFVIVYLVTFIVFFYN